jgi:hypothetical protein
MEGKPRKCPFCGSEEMTEPDVEVISRNLLYRCGDAGWKFPEHTGRDGRRCDEGSGFMLW